MKSTQRVVLSKFEANITKLEANIAIFAGYYSDHINAINDVY